MPKSKTIFNNNCFSVAFPINSKDFTLYDDYEQLKKHNDVAADSSPELLLQNNFQIGQEFLYKISQLKDRGNLLPNVCVKYEIGLGKIVKTGPFVFERIVSLYQYVDDVSLRTNGSTFLSFKPNDYIKIQAVVPERLEDYFVKDFTVLACNQRFTPTPVELQEKTLLGRLDNTIQSIDAQELRTILTDTNIVDAVESTNKPLSLNSKVVDLVKRDSRVAAAAIQARPVANRPEGRRGMIIYNADTNRFEGFDGTKWRGLMWEDEVIHGNP